MENKLKLSKEDLELITDFRTNPRGCASEIITHILNKDETDSSFLLNNMAKQEAILRTGDTSYIEDMLFCQSNALQAMFLKAAINMTKAQNLHQAQVWGSFALKAQSQCRQTLATLIEVKNPQRTTLFIKQQNNAVNQQINNQEPISEGKKTK